MSKYYVSVREVHIQGYIVEAPNETIAKDIAVEQGEIQEEDFDYSHTMKSEHTTVEEIKNETT